MASRIEAPFVDLELTPLDRLLDEALAEFDSQYVPKNDEASRALAVALPALRAVENESTLQHLDSFPCQTFKPLPEPVKGTFAIALDKRATMLGKDFFVRLKTRIGNNQEVPHENIYQIRAQQDLEIDWDESCVTSTTSSSRPYTLGLQTCIAVLMRAFSRSNHNYPSYLSVTHVWTPAGVDKFRNSLQDLIQKTNRGTIEIFLCGGYNRLLDKSQLGEAEKSWQRDSNALYDEIRAVAAKAEIPVVQDLVGLAHIQGEQPSDHRPIPFDFYIMYTGFDENCNPYAIVGVKSGHPDFKRSNPGVWEVVDDPLASHF
jgi:hypothetical protein